ncbi:MAG: hypothetical protein JRG96_00590 [Deltaproteobacteria bacterium]|nr:hypothetical protein [Deltaproteobacteria bacterium]MBW2421801.1 hypothetical protein [Deltaproteobacteria bacterium]
MRCVELGPGPSVGVAGTAALFSALTAYLGLALLASTLFFAPTAHALAQWDLQIDESSAWYYGWGFPQFTVTNTSTAGERVTGIEIYIGDTGYYFDYVRSDAAQAASQVVTGATLLTGDTSNDSSGVDTLVWGFSDFQVGESMSFEADIDPGWWGVNARTILFNNGSADNATVTVSFDDNTQGTLTLPDGDAGSSSYTFLFPLTRAPEPRTSVLVALGLAGLAFAGRPRKP